MVLGASSPPRRNGALLSVAAGLGTGSRPSRTTPRVLYQIPAGTRQSTVWAGWHDPAFGIEWPDADVRTILERDRDYADCRFAPRPRHRRVGVCRTPDARAARRTRLRGPRPRPARARSHSTPPLLRASSTSRGRRTSCTSRGTPSPARSGNRRGEPAWLAASLALLDVFTASGGSRAVIAGHGAAGASHWQRRRDPLRAAHAASRLGPHVLARPRTRCTAPLPAPRSRPRVGPHLLPLRAARGHGGSSRS